MLVGVVGRHPYLFVCVSESCLLLEKARNLSMLPPKAWIIIPQAPCPLTADNGHFVTGMGDATHVGGCGGTPSLFVCMCERVMLVVGEGKSLICQCFHPKGLDNNSPGVAAAPDMINALT